MHSLGWKTVKEKVHLEKVLAIHKNHVKAISGSGHYSATFRTELLSNLSTDSTNLKAGYEILNKFIDSPSVKNGHWRLCTFKNYTYHMGNHTEPWMSNVVKDLKISHKKLTLNKPILKKYKPKLPVSLIRGLIRKLFYRTFLFKYFLIQKGLTKEEAEVY